MVCGDPAAAPETWFVLHGYRQLAGRFIGRFTALPGVASRKRAVVAPEALNRFYVEQDVAGPHGPGSRVGAAWMTREDREHEIADYVDYLDLLRDRVAPAAERVVVLGFSQGAETASRWAVLGGTPPSELVLWGGGLAADLDPDRTARALRGTAITFVVGSDDRWALERSEEGIARLAEHGIEAKRLDYDGGHRVDPAILAASWPLP